MTTLAAILVARAALALLAIAAARRVPALRPVAWMLAALALLAAGALYPVPWLAAGRHVAWPGVLLAGAAWGLRVVAEDEVAKAALVPRVVRDVAEDEPIDSAPQAARAERGMGRLAGDLDRAAFEGDQGVEHTGARGAGHARGLPRLLGQSLTPQRIAAVYLAAAALISLAYRPGLGDPSALAARLVAVVGLVALLARRRPATWAQLAAVLPLAGLAVGVLAGPWPLAQAGLVAQGWHLARAESWITMAATGVAIAAAWWAERRRSRR